MSQESEDTDGFTNQYRCALAIYLMTVISFLYGIIMDGEMNERDNGNNEVDGINATVKRYAKEKTNFIG